MGAIAICCLPEIIVIVIVGAISYHKVQKKKEIELENERMKKNEIDDMIFRESVYRGNWDNSNYNDTTPTSTRTARSPPGYSGNKQDKRSIARDKKGLDEFLAAMNSKDD